jgi:maleylpyruvate isomerase
VRIALGLKGLDYEHVTYDLRTDAHKVASYLAIAPHGLVPALETDEGIIIESAAILEWLEERFSAPPLLPDDAMGKAVVRSMAGIVACDIHPLNNLRVLKALRADLKAGQEAIEGWIDHWMKEGFGGLEALVARYGRGFAYGASPTLADCYLVPQVYAARRFGVDLEAFPAIRAAADRAGELGAVKAAHPDLQPDADRA